jgi:hypothetical protein
MAKAVVPMSRFREKYGNLADADVLAKLREMVEQFLRDTAPDKRKEVVTR